MAASAMPAAIAVDGDVSRTPNGPSAILNDGTPSRGTARMKNQSVPPM